VRRRRCRRRRRVEARVSRGLHWSTSRRRASTPRNQRSDVVTCMSAAASASVESWAYIALTEPGGGARMRAASIEEFSLPHGAA
jgi:hypothetical protein